MNYVFTAIIISTILLAGCMSTDSQNLVVNTGKSYSESKTLADMRAARRSIKIYSEIPSAAYNITELTVKRCYDDLLGDAPTRSVMEDDLVLETFARGADGIANIVHTKESGLLKNCWHIRTATGQTFRLD